MVFVGILNLDFSLLLSRLRVGSPRSVLFARANIDVVIRLLGGRTGAALLKLNGHQSQNW